MKSFRLTLNQKYGYASIFYGVSIILLAIFGNQKKQDKHRHRRKMRL